MKPETGAQPRDGKHSQDAKTGKARLDVPQDVERAARESDHPVKDKFARVWGPSLR
jgi:hypothetical protein